MALRERDLVIRKKTRPVREATDLIAVQAGTGAGAARDVLVGGKRVGLRPLPLDRVAASLPGAGVEQLAHFETAGWVFAARSALGGVPDDRLAAVVLVDPNGQVSLAPPRVSVKLKDPDGELSDVFPVGVVKATPLRFAKGLYSVAFDPGGGKDALEVARELEASGTVEYAEPELLSHFPSR